MELTKITSSVEGSVNYSYKLLFNTVENTPRSLFDKYMQLYTGKQTRKKQSDTVVMAYSGMNCLENNVSTFHSRD